MFGLIEHIELTLVPDDWLLVRTQARNARLLFSDCFCNGMGFWLVVICVGAFLALIARVFYLDHKLFMNFFISAKFALCAEVDLVQLSGPARDSLGNLICDNHPLGALQLALNLVTSVEF